MISHYATRGRCLHLLTDLEEATSESLTRVLVFILTVNNDWSQIYLNGYLPEIDQGSVGYTRDQTFLAVIPLV